MRFHKIFVQKIISNFDTEIRIVDTGNLDLVISSMIESQDHTFPTHANKTLLKDFYNKVKNCVTTD